MEVLTRAFAASILLNLVGEARAALMLKLFSSTVVKMENNMLKTNKVVRISYSGGLLGLLFGSARGKLEKLLSEHNKAGWNLAEVVPDNPNLLIWVVRIIILVLTLGLWTLSNGYLLILERPVGDNASNKENGSFSNTGRVEPQLSASR